MKFVLFVEGHTEKKAVPRFLKKWLDRQLPRPVGIQPVRFEGWAELLDDARPHARLYLAKSDVIAVIALLDLYGPKIYPDNKRTAEDRYAWGKKWLEDRVGDQRFRAFFAVHETEAWLLSDLGLFQPAIRKTLAAKAKEPETVDFGEPPSYLLDHIYERETGKRYKKGSSGFLVGTYDILCSALWGTHPPDPLGFIALEARAAP